MNIKNLLLTAGMLIISIFAFSQNSADKRQDIVYKTVKGHNIIASIYLPKSKEKVPVVVYFHGGGFMFGNREQGLSSVLKEKLLANGIAVISADYRLSPESKLEEILADVNDAVAWIKHNGANKFNIDINKIAVAGGSAGGYLALSAGFKPQSGLNAIVAISPPTGFSTEGIQAADLSLLNDIQKDSIISYGDYTTRMDLWRHLGKNGLALYEIFGFDPVKEPQKLERYTLTNNVKTGYPPTLIIHAKNDHLVKFADAQAFYTFLQEKDIESELYIVENGHDSTLIKQHPEAADKIVAFLKKWFNK